jgi:peptidoglycan hydrolase CwlO-like protein
VKSRLVIVAITILGGLGATAAIPLESSADPSLGELNSQLSQEQARQQSLSVSIAGLSASISSLDGQIALVQSREAEVRAELASDRRTLARIRSSLQRERRRVAMLKARLALARMLLARQLVSDYESDRPDLVSVALESSGFTDLLERIDFLRRAEGQQKTIIQVTKLAKAQADAAERHLAKIEAVEAHITQEALVREQALAGMNALLGSKEAALQHVRDAQQVALAASQARGEELRAAIARIQAEQAAAARAAQAEQTAAASAAQAAGGSGGGDQAGGAGRAGSSAAGASGGWVIPSPIVMCESGGQNLPPNGAGASGYYQIIPSTWKEAGGTGPAAYLAPKSEQDSVAERLWAGGAGASDWVCAGMVGIH